MHHETNIAWGTKASQWKGTATHAARAVDGMADIRQENIPSNCLVTGQDNNGPSWWATELHQEDTVVAVDITVPNQNRGKLASSFTPKAQFFIVLNYKPI